MNRLHIHLSVRDIVESVRFYRALFATEPSVLKDDYAKWVLDDPRVHFAISNRSGRTGLDHLGVQAENAEALQVLRKRLEDAALPADAEMGQDCCYAHSDKYWTVDPQGIAWESFHTLSDIPTFGAQAKPEGSKASHQACCAPQAVSIAFKGRP